MNAIREIASSFATPLTSRCRYSRSRLTERFVGKGDRRGLAGRIVAHPLDLSAQFAELRVIGRRSRQRLRRRRGPPGNAQTGPQRRGSYRPGSPGLEAAVTLLPFAWPWARRRRKTSERRWLAATDARCIAGRSPRGRPTELAELVRPRAVPSATRASDHSCCRCRCRIEAGARGRGHLSRDLGLLDQPLAHSA